MSARRHRSIPRDPRAFVAGDPLRAFAALGVLVYHSAYFVQSARFYTAYGSLGGRILGSFHLGLFIFFALSGYLISAPFVRSFVSGEQLPIIGAYARRRALRIVPAFWAILTIQLLAGGFFGAPLGQVALVYAFAQNFGHGPITRVMDQAWTLDVEMAFYLLVPIAAAILARVCRNAGRRTRLCVLGCTLLAATVGSIAARALGPSAFAWHTSLLAMLPAFIPGIVIAALETTALPQRLRSRRRRSPAALLLAAGLGILAFYAAGIGASRPPLVATQSVDVLGFSLAAMGTGLVVAAARVQQWSTDCCWRVFDNRLLRWIGERSYSLYLVHRVTAIGVIVAASGFVASADVRLVLVLPLILGLSLALAAFSYHWFEKPFLHGSWPRFVPRRSQPEVSV